jgi:hypothetical protein
MMQGQSVVDLNWGEPAFHFNFWTDETGGWVFRNRKASSPEHH